MKVHKKIGSKERLLELFQNVNKIVVKENKEVKRTIKENFNQWGQKIKRSRINEAVGTQVSPNVEEYYKENFEELEQEWEEYIDFLQDSWEHKKYLRQCEDCFWEWVAEKYDELNESFDNPEEKDHEYLNKDHDNVQDGKPDDGTRYPVEIELKVVDPSLEKLKGDDAPIEKGEGEPTLDQIPETEVEDDQDVADEPKVEVEPEVEDGTFGATGELTIDTPVDDAPPVDADVENIEADVADDIPIPGSGEEEEIQGGLADGAEPTQFDNQQVLKGMEVELEHSNDPKVALEITMDHLVEIPDYYDHLEDMEQKAMGADNGEEATGAEVVDAMGDGQEGEAAEEIPDPEAEEEKEMLWGKLDTVDDGVDEMYENYVPKKL